MVMRVLILTGGAVEETFAADYIKKWNPDKVITADKGLLYAKKLDIKFNDKSTKKKFDSYVKSTFGGDQ